MDNVRTTFERHEKKFLLDERQFHGFLEKAGPFLTENEFPTSRIHNIYFDTPDYEFMRRSMEKPVYKEKMRVRSYMPPDEDTPVFVERKKKYKGIVYKRRVSLPLKDARPWLLEKAPCPLDTQTGREIDAFLARSPRLRPVLFLYYDRQSYELAGSGLIRVTFDTNLRYRTNCLSLTGGQDGTPLLPENHYLMELKIPGALPLPLCRLLDELKIYPVSFSKAGLACQLEMEKERRLHDGTAI